MRIKSIHNSFVTAEFTTDDCCLLCRALDEALGDFIRIGQEKDHVIIEALGAAFKAAAIAGLAQSFMIPRDLTALDSCLQEMDLQTATELDT